MQQKKLKQIKCKIRKKRDILTGKGTWKAGFPPRNTADTYAPLNEVVPWDHCPGRSACRCRTESSYGQCWVRLDNRSYWGCLSGIVCPSHRSLGRRSWCGQPCTPAPENQCITIHCKQPYSLYRYYNKCNTECYKTLNSQCNGKLIWFQKSADSTDQRQSTAYAWRSPCLLTMARDGELVPMHHFCHHGDTICHPNSSYLTTKLYGTSTRGCNNIRSFRKIYAYMSTVPHPEGQSRIFIWCPAVPRN